MITAVRSPVFKEPTVIKSLAVAKMGRLYHLYLNASVQLRFFRVTAILYMLW